MIDIQRHAFLICTWIFLNYYLYTPHSNFFLYSYAPLFPRRSFSPSSRFPENSMQSILWFKFNNRPFCCHWTRMVLVRPPVCMSAINVYVIRSVFSLTMCFCRLIICVCIWRWAQRGIYLYKIKQVRRARIKKTLLFGGEVYLVEEGNCKNEETKLIGTFGCT